jgi:hypothetical protein
VLGRNPIFGFKLANAASFQFWQMQRKIMQELLVLLQAFKQLSQAANT